MAEIVQYLDSAIAIIFVYYIYVSNKQKKNLLGIIEKLTDKLK